MLDRSKIDELIDEFVWWDYIDPKSAEDFATEALAEDFDGPALRELAWPQEDQHEIDRLFPLALKELGYNLPSKYDVWIRRVKKYASQIVSGEIGTGAGADSLHILASQAEAAGVIDWTTYEAFDWSLEWGLNFADPFDEFPQDEATPENAPKIRAKAKALLRPIPEPWFD